MSELSSRKRGTPSIDNSKLSGEQIASWYKGVHHRSLAQDKENSLGPVIQPGAAPWKNRFCDYAHRLGMQRAFDYLRTKLGSLEGRSVLDIGCGRGGWIREYGNLGAHVTGVDISPDVIELLTTSMPKHRFLCQDLLRLSVPPASFDVANSVTVLQHLPVERQQSVLFLLKDALKDGGYLVLLENVTDSQYSWVFPHPPSVWTEMAEITGLHFCASWPSNFEVLLRGATRLAQRVGGPPPTLGTFPLNSDSLGRRSLRGIAKYTIQTILAVSSFPVEWILHKVPFAPPSHYVMVFRK